MENAVNIRYLQQADHEAWLELFRQYLIFCETDPETFEIDVVWQRMMDNNFPIFGIGAFINNELSGIGHFVIHASTWTSKPYFYLEDLFTAEHSRKRGIGSKILDFIHEIAKHNGGDYLYWITKESNKAAQALYDQKAEKTDFIQYRIKIEA
ncbi:GNAT family N-acetyltransferase [Bartonella sp. HY329]|uniref:GNAT family N-acetyltransferase n=1 Tax=unclassified Bartonella TaxID=2645622 RepID=UPI0021C76CF1|nr:MULTISPECIES: GNAT family N-acetyltransferase [unclassified Bartonella]UXM95163.1 GNAT family N-acetyltransferase [Bartonella sp. HY329]UXN09486.1 GNAT family N-acetyltransferase [Bartonella sp. HY328]